MAVADGRARRSGKNLVLFVALSRRWWRGGLLLLLIVTGAVLSLWYDGSSVNVVRRSGGEVVTSAFDGAVGPIETDPPAAPMSDHASRPVSFDEESAVTALAPVTTPSVVANVVTNHPFDGLRLERERQRSRQAELLQMTAQDASVSEARRRDAHEQLLSLWQLEAREVEIEHLLLAQGYTGVVVLSDIGAHVVVDGLLDAASAARIGELVNRVAGVRREVITIVDGISSGR